MSKVKLLIEIDEEKYRHITTMPNVYGSEVCNVIRNGIPITDDIISRNRAITMLNEAQVEYDEYYKGLGKAKTIIDNMTTIDEV